MDLRPRKWPKHHHVQPWCVRVAFMKLVINGPAPASLPGKEVDVKDDGFVVQASVTESLQYPSVKLKEDVAAP